MFLFLFCFPSWFVSFMCVRVSFDRPWMGPYHLIQDERYVFFLSLSFSFRTYRSFINLCVLEGWGAQVKNLPPTETEFTADLGTVPPPLTLYTSTYYFFSSLSASSSLAPGLATCFRDRLFLLFLPQLFFTFCVRPGPASRDS